MSSTYQNIFFFTWTYIKDCTKLVVRSSISIQIMILLQLDTDDNWPKRMLMIKYQLLIMEVSVIVWDCIIELCDINSVVDIKTYLTY